MTGRYNINDSLTNYTIGLNQGQLSPQALRTQFGKLDEAHTFSPTLFNEFSVALNRFYSDTNSNTPKPLVGFAGFFTNLGSLPGPNTFNVSPLRPANSSRNRTARGTIASRRSRSGGRKNPRTLRRK